jgi:hypothetical protein
LLRSPRVSSRIRSRMRRTTTWAKDVPIATDHASQPQQGLRRPAGMTAFPAATGCQRRPLQRRGRSRPSVPPRPGGQQRVGGTAGLHRHGPGHLPGTGHIDHQRRLARGGQCGDPMGGPGRATSSPSRNASRRSDVERPVKCDYGIAVMCRLCALVCIRFWACVSVLPAPMAAEYRGRVVGSSRRRFHGLAGLPTGG